MNQQGMGFLLTFIVMHFIATLDTSLGARNTTVCSAQERRALLIFKGSVTDQFGMLSSWIGNDCCQWEGVRCDIVTGNVVGLSLRGHNIWNSYYFPESFPNDDDSLEREDYYYPLGKDCYLIGDEVNSSLAKLRHLKYLDLSGNDFNKAMIPNFIGSLKQLSYLNLSNAGFGRMIPPHVGNLSKLEVLDLSSSKQDLLADDMAWVFGLSSLKHLDLSGVYLLKAQINLDMVFHMIPSLINVSLSHCSLTNAHLGPHLNSSSKLPNIRRLDLSKNYFKAKELLVFLQNMTSLEFLDLSNSDFNLAGNLANLLNMIPFVSELHMSHCQLQNEHLSTTHLNISTLSNIQHLDLSSNSIEGHFPSFLTSMTSLRVLNIRINFLKSSIPVMPKLQKLDISSNYFMDVEHVGIWRHCHLKELRVSKNNLGEEIIGPSKNISECSQYALEVLHLDHNQLIGSIPKSMTRLTNLRVLDLSSNRLTGLIPVSLGRLLALEVLDLSSNQLNGTIPITFRQLSKINFLNVSDNNLEGTVTEAHFANLSMLKSLDMSDNINVSLYLLPDWMPPFQLRTIRLKSCNICCEFPRWLQTQSELKMLVLSNTTITGPLPSWLLKMPIIPHLDLSHNKLRGPLINLPTDPPFSGFQDRYKGSLLLRDNLFNGTIPELLCRRTALEVLELSGNRLAGEIPKCLKNLKKLRAMAFSSNELSGVIPASIGDNSLLSWLHLNNNSFTGELPQELRNLQDLWILDLGDNNISGRIPEWIAELTELMALRLHKNNFTERIPSSLCNIPCLQILDVGQNSLSGLIPGCLGRLPGMINAQNCRHHIYSEEKLMQGVKRIISTYSSILLFLSSIDLSSNQLVGQIPEELTALSVLSNLNLSSNYLSGSIPDNIENLKSLESLDFSDNELTGMIPQSLSKLVFLGYLNMSHNNLSGPIPTGPQLQTFNESSYADNGDLCGIPLPKTCPTTTKNYDQKVDQPKKKAWFHQWDIMSGFATGFCGVIGVLLINKTWRREFYRFADLIMDQIYVAVAIKVNKIKRRREAAA
uniref:receptor-like protein EIX2 n=1 Tax=Erigeron canadensis TaxID=72917 RepID=UPI001CB9996B|nr:receptor-like protein EIX2 [Erigeron canadensis]